MERVLDLLLPQRCGVCALPGSGVLRGVPAGARAAGAAGLRALRLAGRVARAPLPRVCRAGVSASRRARAAILYEPRARALVGRWKERGRRDLSRLAAELVAEVLPPPGADALTFVPGDRDRLLRRGHAPPERLAWELGRLWALPGATASRPGAARAAAARPVVRRAATATSPEPSPPWRARRGRVVLVDDVYTTGSTVSACATALRRAGAERVDVVCLARAVR